MPQTNLRAGENQGRLDQSHINHQGELMEPKVTLEELAQMLPGNPPPDEVEDWLHEHLSLSDRARMHAVEDCETCMKEVRGG